MYQSAAVNTAFTEAATTAAHTWGWEYARATHATHRRSTARSAMPAATVASVPTPAVRGSAPLSICSW